MGSDEVIAFLEKWKYESICSLSFASHPGSMIEEIQVINRLIDREIMSCHKSKY